MLLWKRSRMYEEFPSVLSGLLLRTMYKKWRHKSRDHIAYLSTLGNVREGDLFGGVKHEYATHPRALECSA